jgi:hypothetical protein
VLGLLMGPDAALLFAMLASAPWEAYNTKPSVVANCDGLLDDAVNFISAFQSRKHVVVPDGVCVTSGFTVPIGGTLEIGPGALLKPTGLVNVLGTVSAKPRQWIDLSLGGSVSISNPATGPIYPQWWGAVPNDNQDDTQALRASFLSACTSSRDVSITPGIWDVTGNVRITCNGFTLHGAGSGVSVLRQLTTWLNPNPSVAAIIDIRHADNNGPNGVPISDILIRDIGFRGTGNTHYLPAQGNTGDPKAITSQNADKVTLLRLSADNFGREIVWPAGTRRGTGWTVDTCYFKRVSEITENPGANFEANFDHSTITGSTFVGGYIGIGIGGNKVIVKGNHIIGPILAGISFGDAEGGISSAAVDNDITMSNSTLVAPVFGVYLTDVSKFNVVTGNTISFTQVPKGGGIKSVYVENSTGTNKVSSNMIVLDSSGWDAGMSAISMELGKAGTASVEATDNSITFVNEVSNAQRYGLVCTTYHPAAKLTCSMSNNRIYGLTNANTGGDGFSWYVNQSEGKLIATVSQDQSTGGRGGVKNFSWNDNSLNNVPLNLYTLSDGGVAMQ